MPARIIVDSNEPIEIYEALKSLLDSVDRRRLEPCDYLIGGEVCIERKTPRDFLNSIYDGRVFDQVRRILEVYERAILLISGLESMSFATVISIVGPLSESWAKCISSKTAVVSSESQAGSWRIIESSFSYVVIITSCLPRGSSEES